MLQAWCPPPRSLTFAGSSPSKGGQSSSSVKLTALCVGREGGCARAFLSCPRVPPMCVRPLAARSSGASALTTRTFPKMLLGTVCCLSCVLAISPSSKTGLAGVGLSLASFFGAFKARGASPCYLPCPSIASSHRCHLSETAHTSHFLPPLRQRHHSLLTEILRAFRRRPHQSPLFPLSIALPRQHSGCDPGRRWPRPRCRGRGSP